MNIFVAGNFVVAKFHIFGNISVATQDFRVEFGVLGYLGSPCYIVEDNVIPMTSVIVRTT